MSIPPDFVHIANTPNYRGVWEEEDTVVNERVAIWEKGKEGNLGQPSKNCCKGKMW